MNPVIGIIGGMGPLATCDLMQKIIEYTDADTDQEHVRICVDCNTNIPDRTAAILQGGKNPVPELVKSAKRLEAMGVISLRNDLPICAIPKGSFFLVVR